MGRKRSSPKQDDRADFVFQGTVTAANASAMKEVPATERTVIVRVDRLIQSPESLSDYAGQEITVQIADGKQVLPGQTLVFHTHGWVFGEGLAVQSIKEEESSPSVIASMSSHADDPVANLAFSAAKQQADAADLVVTGHVSAVRLPDAEVSARATNAASGRTTERISEHAPLWQEAVVDIDQVHKGQHSKKQVVIRFPSSTDVKWRNAPKFRTGQEGVFLLHKDQMPKSAVASLALGAAPLDEDQFTALQPADFQPLDQLPRLI